MNNSFAVTAPTPDAIVQDALDEVPVAYVEVNSEGVITRANRAARAFHPEALGDIVGRSAFEFAPADQTDHDRHAFLAMMASGDEPPVTRRTLLSGAGEYRTYELHRKLIRDAAGRPTGVRAVTVDVTEAQSAHDEAREARQWLESALDAVVDAVILTDALGFVRNMNRAAESLFGCSASALIGQPIEDALPILCFPDAGVNRLNFSTTLDKPSKTFATMRDREGRPVRLEICTSPIRDRDSGCTLGVVNRWRIDSSGE